MSRLYPPRNTQDEIVDGSHQHLQLLEQCRLDVHGMVTSSLEAIATSWTLIRRVNRQNLVDQQHIAVR